MYRLPGFLLLLIALAIGPCSILAQEPKVQMSLVKYEGLKQEVLKHRGKVVLVDFWATYCPPCMAAFPKIIEMQKKYSDQGFVVISVSGDDAMNPEKVKKANAFLTRMESPFKNLLLEEPMASWGERLGIKALPCYYVFDRRGKWVRYRGEDYPEGIPYEDMEKVVQKMLSEK